MIHLPFFYFVKTRLQNRKAFLFHFAYEWVPGLVIAWYVAGMSGFVTFLLSYLAFISIYELGYALNDQLSFTRMDERTRHEKFSAGQWVLFVGTRIAAFALLTFFLGLESQAWWWLWYGLLTLMFLVHNILTSSTLKCVTFLHLAFMRFLSPVILMLSVALLQILALPVLLNYALFRLFIYMDSKKLLLNFDRTSPRFLIGYYALMLGFAAFTSFLFSSKVPVGFTLYYLGLSVIFARFAYMFEK